MNKFKVFEDTCLSLYEGERLIVFGLDAPADIIYNEMYHSSTRKYIPDNVKAVLNNRNTYRYQLEYGDLFIGWETWK